MVYSMKNIQDLRPSWNKRRPIIIAMLAFMCAVIVLSGIASIVLAVLAKYGFYVFTFFMTMIILAFACLIGIIGSYIFGAQWETKDYFNLLKDVVPKINNEEE